MSVLFDDEIHVHYRVEWHEREPPIAPAWDDAVEVSLTPEDDACELRAFDHAERVAVLPPVTHRASWYAAGMDAGHEVDVRQDGEPPVDRSRRRLPAPARRSGPRGPPPSPSRHRTPTRACRATPYPEPDAGRGRQRAAALRTATAPTIG